MIKEAGWKLLLLTGFEEIVMNLGRVRGACREWCFPATEKAVQVMTPQHSEIHRKGGLPPLKIGRHSSLN